MVLRWLVLPVVLVTMVGSIEAMSNSGETTGVRQVTASERSLIPLQTRLRYTTMIVLPAGEEILDVICGDKAYWVVSATHNIAYVKPAKDGAATNLNLVTAGGVIYSFLLTEKSGTALPDLKVYVEADTSTASSNAPKYYTAAQVELLQNQLKDERAAVEAATRHAAEMIAASQREYPGRLQFVYGTPKYEKPFLVRAIWNDGQSTYVKTDATELPTLHEVTDGAPALVNFQVDHGTYVVPKVLDRGYLALGKGRFEFARQGR